MPNMIEIPSKTKTFNHRFALKNMGAKWDKLNKTWSIPESMAPEAFRLVGLGEYKPGEHKKKPAPSGNHHALNDYVGDAVNLCDLLPDLEYRTAKQSFMGWSTPEKLGEHVKELVDNGATLPWYSTIDCFNSERARGIEMAPHGWLDGIERVSKLREKISLSHPTAKQATRHDVAGAYPIVPRAVAGNPLHMRRIETSRTRKRPVVTLVTNISGNCMIPNKCFTNRAGVVAAIVDMIEATGYSVHLIAATCATGPNHNLGAVTAITVKEPGQPVDVPRLAFAVGHADFFRGLVLVSSAAHMARAPLGSGNGHSCEFSIESARQKNVYVLPSVNRLEGCFMTEERAETKGLSLMIEALHNQGCPGF
jgi:hypothetical protein